MTLNYLLILGYIIGVLWSVANKEYEFTLKTPDGKKNILKSVIAFLFVIVMWYFAFFIKLDDNMPTDSFTSAGIYAVVCFVYFMTGFCAEYVLKAGSKFYKQYFNKTAKAKLDLCEKEKENVDNQPN